MLSQSKFYDFTRWSIPVLLLLGGCDVPEDRNGPIDSSEEELLNGIYTKDAPEVVGLYMNPGICTATMISPRHFLTAAHCFDYEPVVRGRFTIWATNGDYAVARVFSLSTQGESGDRSKDLAVGQIVDSAPDLPWAPIASSKPTQGPYTVVGFGRLVDGDKYSAGVKRYLTFNNYPPHIAALGDSGGPLLKGTLLGPREVVGVLSECIVKKRPFKKDKVQDIYADPIEHLSTIQSLVDSTSLGDICYRVHVEQIGWMPAVCDGRETGTLGKRIDAIQIWSSDTNVNYCYQAHVEKEGWQKEVCNGDLAGTVGRRLEAIKVKKSSSRSPQGDLVYQVYVQGSGWQNSVGENEMAGTEGKSLRIEAVRMGLVGEEEPCIMIGDRPLRCTDYAASSYCSSCGKSGVPLYSCSYELESRSTCNMPLACDNQDCGAAGRPGLERCITAVKCNPPAINPTIPPVVAPSCSCSEFDWRGSPVRSSTCGELFCLSDCMSYTCETAGWTPSGGQCAMPNPSGGGCIR